MPGWLFRTGEVRGMTREEAVVVAEGYLSANDIPHGPLRVAHYFTGAESEYLLPPHWGVYFWNDQPVDDPPDDMAATCLCVSIDAASGAAHLISWL